MRFFAFRNFMFMAVFLTFSCSASSRDKAEDLIGYIERGETAAVQETLESGVQLDYLAKDGKTPLIVAVMKENQDIVEILLKHGASVDFPGAGNVTAMHVAIEQSVLMGNDRGLEIARFLLAKGADPNYMLFEGRASRTVFSSLVSNVILDRLGQAGSVLIDQMIAAGADVNARVQTPVSLLKSALQFNKEEVVRQLICAGNRPNKHESEIQVTEESHGFYRVKYTLSTGKIFSDYVVDCRSR